MNHRPKKIIAAMCAATVVCAAVTTAAVLLSTKGPFKGTVKDDKGAPLAGVSVTDGMHVVKTDSNGDFTLKGTRKSHFVTVTVPAGYRTERYYIATDKTVSSYDFVLAESAVTAAEDHSFIQISDTEIGEKGTGEWLSALKQIVAETKPAFLIHTGDICYEAGLKKHIEDMNTDTMGCTVYYVIGNHDYVQGKFGEELYERLYGPVWYSFEVGNVHYVVTSFQDGSDYKSLYNQKDRWRWLANDLANTDPDMKVVMFNHTMSPTDDYVLSFDGKTLDLKEHSLIAWIFGHYHYNYIDERHGVLNISTARPDCGGIDSSVSGARIINVSADGSMQTEMKYYDMSQGSDAENVLWTTKLAGNALFCDTVYDNGCIYMATIDDDYPRDCGIYCLDYESGDIKWQYHTKNSVKNNLVISGDKLLTQDTEGYVYCLDKNSGELLWQQQAKLGNALGTSSGICADENNVYVGASRVISSYAISSGELNWSLNRDKGENSPSEFILMGDKLIIGSHWDALVAIDKHTGKELWANSDSAIRFRSSTPVAIDENTLLVADSDAVMKVDVKNGDITQKTTVEGYDFASSGQPVVSGSTAYIPTANKGLIAYDLATNAILWTAETDPSIVFTPPYKGKGAQVVESTPVLVADKVIFGAGDGFIYEVSVADGRVITRHFAGSSVFGKVYYDNGNITAGTFGGQVMKF